MWAITTYYNPARYESKLYNFKAFHQRLGLPLVVVEHVLPEGQSELAPYLAEYPAQKTILVVVNQGDIMWQKERLLNVALTKVPKDVKHVVWIDNDLIFPDSSWIAKLAVALDKHPLVQCFGKVRHLPPLAIPTSPSDEILSKWTCERPSFAHMEGSAGYVWAGHADLLRRHGFYDAMIVGDGDVAFLRAAAGLILEDSEYAFLHRYTLAHVRHCDAWGQAFYKDLKRRGSLGCLHDTVVYHLWHGQTSDRRYRTRQHILDDHAYDPNVDIRINESGSWSWNSDKPNLHTAVANYFQSRQEDLPV